MTLMTIFEQARGPHDAALAGVPLPTAARSELEAFCQAISGPEGDHREISELVEIAHQVEANMDAASVGDLLSSAYFHWRKFRWNEGLDVEAERALRSVIGELQRRAREGPAGA